MSITPFWAFWAGFCIPYVVSLVVFLLAARFSTEDDPYEDLPPPPPLRPLGSWEHKF